MQLMKRHNASFDYARLVAVIGIIWFHAKAPGAVVGYAGLAYFLILTVCVSLPQIGSARDQVHRAPAGMRYTVKRAQRLLLPWLVASLFYGGFKLLEVFAGAPFAEEFRLDMLVTGPAPHLWYLPFTFLLSVVLWPLGRWFRTLPERNAPLIAGVFGALAIAGMVVLPAADFPSPFTQWAYALPIVLTGVGLLSLSQNVSWMACFTALFVCLALICDATAGLMQLSIAATVLILCRARPMAVTPHSDWSARASLLIYLVHPAFMSLATRGLGVPEGSTGLAVVVTALSLAFVFVWKTIAAPRLAGRLQFT